MFGYELNHLILFEWEVLQYSLQEFSQIYSYILWLGLIYNLALLFGLKIFQNANYYRIPLIISCLISGYGFHWSLFRPIFWPCGYIFGFSTILAVLLALQSYMDSDQQLEKNRKVIFHALTFGFTALTTLLFEGAFITLGGSLFLCCIGSLIISASNKGLINWGLTLLSILYIISSSAIYYHFLES